MRSPTTETTGGGWPPWLVDAAIGVAVTGVVSAVIAVNISGDTDPDALAYLWAVGLGALMLARRRYPVSVLAVTVLGLFAYYAAGYPAIGVAVPVAAALLAAAEFGRTTAAVVGAVTVLGTSIAVRLVEGDAPAAIGYELAGHVLLMAAAIALGDALRSRRRAGAAARRVEALTADRVRREAAETVQAERLAVARDLHDSVGHAATVIAMHAEIAEDAIGRDDDAARDAVGVVRRTARAALRDLRSTVRLLREPGTRSPHGLADVEELIAPAVAAGVDVRVDIASGPLPGTVDAAAYRVVQEAVTNVVRHSRARTITIEGRRDADRLLLMIADDGPGSDDPGADPKESTPDNLTPQPWPDGPVSDNPDSNGPGQYGHGIAGMRERVTALGGRFDARREAGGFVVRAELPLPADLARPEGHR